MNEVSLNTIRKYIEFNAKENPQSDFVSCPHTNNKISNKQLKINLDKINFYLVNKKKQKKNSIICTLIENSLSSIQLMLGIMYSGMIQVPLNLIAGEEQLSYIVNHSESKIIFASSSNLDLAKRIVNKISSNIEIVEINKDNFVEEIDNEFEIIKENTNYNDNALLMYTSGTTGKPKGVLHGTGGYLTHLNSTFQWAFDIKDSDVFFCTADIGWVTGHSYVVYGPLLYGATEIMYEGVPDYPSISRIWDIIQRYGVTIFYTTPTALRMFMKFGDTIPNSFKLSSLRLLGTVGEPINPEVWRWYFKTIGKSKCPIVDTWWQTETGGMMLSPLPGLETISLKPGSATRPIPGIDITVVDERGNELPPDTKGYLVIRKPWPGMLLTLWGDDEKYKNVYWSKFENCYYPGDYATKDPDGYFWLLGRADDILKVAGHRIGTAEIESSLVSHRDIAEAAVCGIPDEIKGEVIVAFTVLKDNAKNEPSLLRKELMEIVRNGIGPIATPQQIYFVTKLPKTRSGKIMRRILKAIASNEKIGDVSTLEDGAAVKDVQDAFTELERTVRENKG